MNWAEHEVQRPARRGPGAVRDDRRSFISVYGICHIRTAGPLHALEQVMRSSRTSPRSATCTSSEFGTCSPRLSKLISSRHRRVRLAGAGLSLVTLPPSVPVDGSLALRAAHEASVLSDRWSGAWSFLGAVYYRLGRLDEAERAIRTALKRPQDPQEHPFNPLVLTLIYARRGNRERALAEFQLFRKVGRVNMWLAIREPLEAEARTMLGLAPDAIADSRGTTTQ